MAGDLSKEGSLEGGKREREEHPRKAAISGEVSASA